jgi:methionyl-tRNA formyltransferase
MASIVFFGLDGPFSIIPLRALVASGLAPSLVVHGLEKQPRALRPIVEERSARPGLLERVMDSLRPHEERGASTDLSKAAHDLGIDVLRTSDANDPSSVVAIRSRRPDALIVAGFPHLLSKAILDLARCGGVNVHPGRLPEERGPSPLFWALKDGRTTIGFAIHILDEREDAGALLASGTIDFTPGTDGRDVLAGCATAAVPHLIGVVRSLLAGESIRFPQDEALARRRPRPKFRDGLIDPSRPARDVFTFVGGCARAYSLFVECGGDRFFVARAESYDDAATLGFEYVLTGDRLILRCSPGVVELSLREEGALFSAEYVE